MPSHPFTLSSWSDNASVGAKTWTNPTNAQFIDGSYAGLSGLGVSHYLYGTGPSVLGSTFASNETLSSITILIDRFINGGTNQPVDNLLYLIGPSGILTGINFASASIWPSTLTQASYTVSSANLATLGITKSSLTSAFVICLSIANSSGVGTSEVDQIAGTFNTTISIPPDIMTTQTRFIPGVGIRNL